MEQKFKEILALNLKVERTRKRLTQKQLADRLGMSLNFIGKIEVGYDHPSLYTLIDIANNLEIPLKNLFD